MRTHLTEFLAAVDAATDGDWLPGFVVRELRKFLRCGVLAHLRRQGEGARSADAAERRT